MHDGAFACLELEGQAHGLEGQQKIGKDDGGVHAELFRGGDGDFGGDVGLLADFDQRVVLADVAILLHVAASLAQEPDRRAVNRLAQAGADEAAAIEERVRSGSVERVGSIDLILSASGAMYIGAGHAGWLSEASRTVQDKKRPPFLAGAKLPWFSRVARA